MSEGLKSLIGSRRGAAAAEMALVIPFLVTILFGSIEMGRYFMSSHIVAKAVRDGARFASRQSFTSMPCNGTPTNETDIKNLVRTGTTASGGNSRLPFWTSAGTITITITCDSTAAYTASGIYVNATGGARRVTVTASVPYQTLFGFTLGTLTVPGRSEAAVMGI